MSTMFDPLCRGLFLAAFAGVVVGGAAGGYVGYQHAAKSVKTTYAKERQDLLEYIQLQDEIGKARDKQWQVEYQKVYQAYQKLDEETVERDYEEFKAPDTNNDDMISRAEFNTYVRKYLSSFPELSEKDFPKFEEFDLDGDGMVSFDEWQQFLVLQKEQEAKKGKTRAIGDGSDSKKNDVYNDLLNALYEQSYESDSFDSLNRNMDSKKSSGGRYNRNAFDL